MKIFFYECVNILYIESVNHIHQGSPMGPYSGSPIGVHHMGVTRGIILQKIDYDLQVVA